MPLKDEDRRAIWAEFMADASTVWEPIAVGQQPLRAAVDAIDRWVDDNQASFNQAIPQPARSALTAKQKVKLLMKVVSRRWEVG